jgi:hypothetical protein
VCLDARILVGAAMSLAMASAQAATPLAGITLSTDATLVLGTGNLTLSPQQIAAYVPAGSATAIALPPAIPSGVAIAAYDHAPGATHPHRLVFDTTVVLGGVTFTPRDVAQTDGAGAWSKYFDGVAAGLPAGVALDALAHDPASGQMLFSLDSFAALPGGVNLDPRSIGRYSGAAFSLAYDLSAAIPAGVNLANLDALPNGRLLVGLDTTATVGGVTANDEDMLEYTPATGAWEANFVGAANDADLAASALSAFSAQLPPGITVNPVAGLNTSEAGATAAFTLVLDTPPSANVVIGLSSSDTTEGSVAPASLTFTPANWNLAQTVTVTGVDDALVDGPITYTVVTAAATSADAAYNGLNPGDVSVSNIDNDVPPGAGIVVSPISGLITTEAGGTASFSIRLNSAPTANVSIGLSSSDTSEGTVGPASVTFTPANWNTPQSVTVTGVDDALVDGDIAYSIVTAPAVSADLNYSGRNASDVSVRNIDNESGAPGIVVTPQAGLITTEVGGTATFTVRLNSAPTANVVIGLSSSDTSEGAVAPTSLTFTPANWNTPQSVTATGAADALVDGDVVYAIVTAASVSADPAYSGLNPADVSLTNRDSASRSGDPAAIPTLSGWGLMLLSMLLAGLAGLAGRGGFKSQRLIK